MKNSYFKSLLTVVSFLCTTMMFAEIVVVDGITYEVVTKAKVASVITGDTKYIGDIVIPESIEYNGVTCEITSIGVDAFVGCSGLTSITLPNTITNIGEAAFCECYGLTSVMFPGSIKTIEDYAFLNCHNLERVYITDIASWCNIDFKNESSNPLFYANNLYLNNELVTELIIPNDVTNVGNYAFSGSNLKSITIPNSITNIGVYAFHKCSVLTSISIGCGIMNIGDYVFSDCSSLNSVIIPNNVTNIGWCAFAGCSNLTSVTIGNGVINIGGYAFYKCNSLIDVTIPNCVTTIGGLAFSECSSLTSLTIGSGIQRIAVEAFAKCKNLTDVYCHAITIPSTDANAFYESYPEYMTLYVPDEVVYDYASNTPWSSFGKILTIADSGSEEGTTDVVNGSATAAQISTTNGKVTISSALNGTSVAVYTVGGELVGSTTLNNGIATVDAGISTGTVVIVKIGEKSVKVMMQ